MPHIITGEIRKEPYTKEGQNSTGNYKMYAIDLSESFKPRNGEREYSNYRAVFFANDNMRQWYDGAFQQGNIVSVSCDAIKIDQSEHNGKNYITLEMVMPKLVFSQRVQQQQNNQAQPAQQTAQNQSAQPSQQKNFDDDIPF